MLKVIGGVYREICLEPNWNQLVGSGLRSSIAAVEILKLAGVPVHLESWVAEGEKAELEAWAKSYGIETELHAREDSIEFQYEHGLSIPNILPAPNTICPISATRIVAEKVLLFGLQEDNPNQDAVQLEAKQVVYDPQGDSKSIPFSHKGLKAERLAIVANLTETISIAAKLGVAVSEIEDKPYSLGRAILEKECAEVVVIKNGAEGAFVVTNDDQHHVLSYKTQKLFKIGSGDVFSGVFAACWLGQDADPITAARRASSAAAFYCNRGGLAGLPIPANQDDVLSSGIIEHSMPSRSSEDSRKQVYIAGPLFNFQQRWFIQEVRRCLESQGVVTFSPYHDVGLSSESTIKETAAKDIEGLEASAAVFAIVDGLDAGTLFEIGYAAAKGIPVIAYVQCTDKRDLLMIEGSPSCAVHNDLPSAIYHAAWAALES